VKLTFLGTNGWYDNAAGATICAALETATEYIVLDAGFGIQRLDSVIKTDKPIYIYLSHTHIDHVCGLHALNKFAFAQGIKICVSKPALAPMKKLVAPPYSVALDKLRMKVRFIKFSQLLRELPHCSVAPLMHSVPCFGLRVQEKGKVFAYGPDTGLCPGLEKIAKDADLLACECSYLPGERNPGWPHMNPQDAATLAKRVGVKKLCLTHFEAKRYPDRSSRAQAQSAARKIFKNTFAVKDGMSFNI
jgi:ribonuclease BN (tRNA processing enzyme)